MKKATFSAEGTLTHCTTEHSWTTKPPDDDNDGTELRIMIILANPLIKEPEINRPCGRVRITIQDLPEKEQHSGR